MDNDSDCSEDYDTDMFFEGLQLRKVPSQKELVASQKAMLFQRGGENNITIQQISQHPNQNVAMMEREQQQELLDRRSAMANFTRAEQETEASDAPGMINQGAGLMFSSLQSDIEVGMTRQCSSFQKYIKDLEERLKLQTMKDKINEQPSTMQLYFNYDLKPDNWNLLVNKQIYMKFERLLIEK